MRHRLLLVFAAICLLLVLMWTGGEKTSRTGGMPEASTATGRRVVMEPEAQEITKRHEAVLEQISAPGDALSAFDAWTAKYLAAGPDEREAMIAEGMRLARERRPMFKQLIKDDPRRALELAVPMVTRQKLPFSIVSLLERRANTRAWVNVYQGVPAEGQPLPEPGRTLTHRIAQLPGEGAYNLHVYGRRAQSVMNLPNAALNGVIIDREFAANESPLRVLEVGEVPDTLKRAVTECPVSGKVTLDAADAALPITAEQQDSVVETPEENIYLCGPYHATYVQQTMIYGEGTTGGPVMLTGALPAPPTPAIGQLKILYIPMTFQDQNANLPTESKCYEIMRNVADYYSKSSFGKLTTQTTVTPPVKLPKNEAWYVQRDSSNGGDIDGLSLELAHAREEVKKLGFDYLDYDCTVLRLIGGPRSTGGWGGSGNVWVYGDSVGVTAHEIGHSFGLSHANFWDTAGTSAIGPGANAEYGDSYDVMGGGGVPTDHYNAAAKVQVKWMPQSYVQNVTASGLYRVYAFDQQVLDPRNRYALTITKDSQRTYWGEVRQLYNGSSSRPWADKGMILGWKYPNGSGSNIQLIDTTPGSPYNKDDAAIALGQTFGDTEAGIFMTTVGVSSTTPKYVDVLVNIGDFSTDHAPALTLAASSNVVPTGATVTFTATASDEDGDTLAYQWQHWGDTTLKLVSPNAPVITRTFSTAGSYVVSCTVSDMKGGSVTRTTLVTVGNGGGTYTISGRVTTGGAGLPGVLLTANGINPTITDADGYYTIPNLAANTYSVTPALYGYTFTELFNNSITVGPNFSGANFDTEVLPSVAITAPDASATENGAGATGTFRLARTGDTSLALTVNVNPAVGTASTGDYTLSPALTTGSNGFSTFTIPADASTLDVVLTTVNDAAAEGPETVTFALAAGSGYLITPNAGRATVVIDDDDTALPKIGLMVTTDTADEGTGTPGVLTLTRSGATTAALTVNYAVSGSAASGTDFTALAGSAVIPAGSSSVTVNVTPLNDTLVEPLETVVLTLSSNAAYVIDPTATSGTVSMLDDDTNVVSVVATDATAQEIDLTVPGNVANTGTFLVSRTGDTTSPLTVYYSVAGNPSTGVPAVHGVDYEALPGVLQIPAGAASATITILPRWDGFGETAEQVLLQLGGGPTDYRLDPANNAATVTVNDGAAASNLPYVEVAAATAAVEGGSNGAFTFSLKGSQAGTVSVPFTLSGTATITSDYTVTLPATTPASTFDTATGTGSLTMTSTGSTANTASVTIVPVNDTALEDIESIVCAIPANAVVSTFPPTASASLWLRDNDQPTVWADSQVGTSAATINRITEGASTSPFKFYVSRTGSTAAALTVNFSLNGTATPGTDYTVTTGATLTFNNGTRTGTLTIPAASAGANVTLAMASDTTLEGTETIVFHAEAGSYSRTADAVIYLDDNDTGTTVAFTSAGGSGAESTTSVNIPVTLSAAASSPTSVDYMLDTGSRSSSTTTNTVMALPYWTRLVRAGSSISSFVSSDGVVWSQVGAAQTVAMSSTNYTVGLVAMSSTSGTSCTATLDNVSITGIDAGGTVAPSATFSTIGTTNPASSTSENSGVYTMNAGGTTLTTLSGSDIAAYAYFAVTSSVNCTITARVTGIANGNSTSRAGVTIRESTATGAMHMACLGEKGGTARTIYRATTNGLAANMLRTTMRPYWVRLRRVGDVFSAWSSADGAAWVQTGTNQTIPMGVDVQAGLAVSSKVDGTLTTAVFDNVMINGVAASGLTGRTIGYVNAQGSDSLASGVYTVNGTGAQIGSTEDECHFVAKTLTGDFDLVARVISTLNGSTTSQAGVMAREMNSYRSLSAYSGLVATAHAEFIYRNSTTGSSFGDGVDFSLPYGTLTFNIGEQTKNIVLAVTNDTIPEPNEALTIKLLNPVACALGTVSAFTFVIDDDDAVPALPLVGFAQSTGGAVEAAAGTQQVAVALSAPVASTVSVDYAVSGGTATSGSDFTLAAGTLSFAAGESVANIPLTILDDSLVDAAETIVITLSNPVGAALSTQSTHTFTITDDDLPVVSITAADSAAAESPLDTGSFTVSRTGPTTGALAVNFTISGATNGTDYTSIGTSVVIPAGQGSATITITPSNDATNEGAENATVTLSSSANYTLGTPSSAAVTIADDDRSTVTIAATDAVASETAGNTGVLTLTRTAPVGGSLTVTLTIAGTAANTTDYATLSTSVVFAANETTKTLTITPVDDLSSEGDEVVLVSIASGSYTIGGTGFDQVTIQDNDYPPVITITRPSANGILVSSGHGVIVSATATDDGSPAALTTTWSQAGGPGVATFTTPNALSSAVTFETSGVYTLKFTASDTQFTVSDQINVIVGAAIAPADWIAQDMSPTTQQRGQSAKVGGTYILTGMGAGYSAVTTDGAHVMTRPVTGDGSITARLTSLGGPATSPAAGVTIRDSLNRSVNRAVLGYNAGALQFRTRTAVSTNDTVTTQGGVTLPVWIKLERVSSTGLITASFAPDSGGVAGAWTTIGSTAVTMLNDTTQMGLTATGNSSTAGQLCSAVFDNVTLTPAPSGPALAGENFGTAPTTQATFSASSGLYTIAAADSMDGNGAFYGWQYHGDVMITAKHVDATSGALNAKSGIMIRESLDSTAGYVHLGRITTGSFSGYIWRSVAGGSGGGVPSFTGKIRWMRLIREGNRVTAFHAADVSGAPGTWTQLGSPRTIIMTPNVLVGFAVDNAGGTAGVLNTAQFSNLSIVPLNKAPEITLAAVATWPVSPVALDGTVTDDNYPLPVSLVTTWSRQSGPAVTFGSPGLVDTTAAFSQEGNFVLRLSADDSSIVTFKEQAFTGYPHAFAVWQAQNWPVSGGADPAAGQSGDADFDGQANLLEYAFGTAPQAGNTSPVAFDTTVAGADKYLRITVPKNPAATDVVFEVQATGDLSNPASWSSSGLVIEQDTPTQLIVRDAVPASPSQPRFMRVKVIRQ